MSVRPDTGVFHQHAGGGLRPLRENRLLRLEREELYREVGQIYATRRSFFEAQRRVVGGRVGHVVIDQTAGWRLRSEWDWQIAEGLARQMQQAPPAARTT